MVRIQITLNRCNYGQPKTIFPTNFKVDIKNQLLEVRDVSMDDAKLLLKSVHDEDKKNVKVREKSSYGGGLDIYMPLEIIESILTFKS